MQGKDLTIDHHVDGSVEFKVYAPHCLVRRQGVLNMRAVVQGWQIADEAKASDWAPAHVLDQTVVYFGLGRDHHGATGELAVVEGKEKTSAVIDGAVAFHAQRERTPLELRQASEDGQNIAQLPIAIKAPSSHGCDICSEADAQKIDVVDDTLLVFETQNVAGLTAAGQQGVECGFDALLAEIAQKGIACSEGQKSKCRPFLRQPRVA